jgi:calcium/calmodulin-dependent protein kinase I
MVVEEGPDWWVKIADFGISKRRHDVTTLQTLQRGTMGFAAPEALGVSDGTDGPYSTAVDMWSLGAVAFLMLTGQSAFRNFAELAGYCSGTRKFPAEILQEFAVSGEAQDFVASLMLLEPAARPLADKALQHRWMEIVINTAHIVGAAVTTGTV